MTDHKTILMEAEACIVALLAVLAMGWGLFSFVAGALTAASSVIHILSHGENAAQAASQVALGCALMALAPIILSEWGNAAKSYTAVIKRLEGDA